MTNAVQTDVILSCHMLRKRDHTLEGAVWGGLCGRSGPYITLFLYLLQKKIFHGWFLCKVRRNFTFTVHNTHTGSMANKIPAWQKSILPLSIWCHFVLCVLSSVYSRHIWGFKYGADEMFHFSFIISFTPSTLIIKTIAFSISQQEQCQDFLHTNSCTSRITKSF